MKLFNVIVVYDVYTVAESDESARQAVLQFVRDQAEPLPTSEHTAVEVRRKLDVRLAWQGEKPLVAADVSDEDFEKVKGKTTLDVYSMLHEKQPDTDKKEAKK